MLTDIKKFADNSETLKESRINVKDTSLIKEIGLYIVLYMVLMACMMISENLFLKIRVSDFNGLSLFSFIVAPHHNC